MSFGHITLCTRWLSRLSSVEIHEIMHGIREFLSSTAFGKKLFSHAFSSLYIIVYQDIYQVMFHHIYFLAFHLKTLNVCHCVDLSFITALTSFKIPVPFGDNPLCAIY